MVADRSRFGDEPLEPREHEECQRIGREWAAPSEADDAAVDNPLQLVEPDGRWPDEDPTRNVSEATCCHLVGEMHKILIKTRHQHLAQVFYLWAASSFLKPRIAWMSQWCSFYFGWWLRTDSYGPYGHLWGITDCQTILQPNEVKVRRTVNAVKLEEQPSVFMS